jgi:hypothetical protein
MLCAEKQRGLLQSGLVPIPQADKPDFLTEGIFGGS